MKKSIYLFVISIVTIVCVIVGTAVHNGGFYGFWNLNGSSAGKGEFQELEAFEQIITDTDVMEFTVKHGSKYGVTYDCTKDLMPEIEVEDKKLIINQKKDKKYLVGNNRCNVIVEIPYDVSLKSVDIKTDVGNISLEKLTIDSCTGKLDVGEISINDCSIEKMEWSNDTGDMKLDNCSFTDLELKSDIGEISIDSAKDLSGYEFDVKTNVGEVKVDGENYGRKCKMKGSEGKIEIKTDIGDVKIED